VIPHSKYPISFQKDLRAFKGEFDAFTDAAASQLDEELVVPLNDQLESLRDKIEGYDSA